MKKSIVISFLQIKILFSIEKSFLFNYNKGIKQYVRYFYVKGKDRLIT